MPGNDIINSTFIFTRHISCSIITLPSTIFYFNTKLNQLMQYNIWNCFTILAMYKFKWLILYIRLIIDKNESQLIIVPYISGHFYVLHLMHVSSGGGSCSSSWTLRLTAEFAKIGSAYPTTHLVLTRTKCIWVITSWGPPFSGFQNKFSFILRVSSTYPNLPRHSLLYYNVHYLVPDKYRQTYRHT